MTIGERITERRKVLKVSQEELAFMLSTNQRQISRYERGENDPTGDVLARLADALNTTTDYLLGRSAYPDGRAAESGDLSADEIELVTLLRMNPKKRDMMIRVIKEIAQV